MGYKRDVTGGTAAQGCSWLADSDRSQEGTSSINGGAESDLDSDRLSPYEDSDDSSEELTGASLAPSSFDSDSDSASETALRHPCTCCYSQQRRIA